jgi:hypothetical protein
MIAKTSGDTTPWLSTAVTWLFVFVGITATGLGAIAVIPKADRGPAASAASVSMDSATQSSSEQPPAQAIAAKNTASANMARVVETSSALPVSNARTNEASEQLAQATPRPASSPADDADSNPTPAAAKSTAAKTTSAKSSTGKSPSGKTQPKKDPPAATGDAARRAAYKKAVAAARAAMAARNMPLAKRNVKTATDNAQTAAEVAEAGRLQTLQDHVEQFWDGVRDAVSKYEATQEIVLPDNNRVAVIDASRDGLSVMYEGRPREFHIDTIPIGLLSSIAKTSFKATPGSKIVVGSFLAMDREGNRTEARKLWNEAAKAGETLGKELLPELDVPLAGKAK